MTRKIAFFEGWSWFKFNNLGLALVTNLKFCTSVAKGLKRVWGPYPTFCRSCREKTGRVGTFLLPPSWIVLTLFRMGIFGNAHGWGEPKRLPYLKSVKHIPPRRNLAQLNLTERRSEKYMNHVTHPLTFADISIFSPEIIKFCYTKKYRYRLRFST